MDPWSKVGLLTNHPALSSLSPGTECCYSNPPSPCLRGQAPSADATRPETEVLHLSLIPPMEVPEGGGDPASLPHLAPGGGRATAGVSPVPLRRQQPEAEVLHLSPIPSMAAPEGGGLFPIPCLAAAELWRGSRPSCSGGRVRDVRDVRNNGSCSFQFQSIMTVRSRSKGSRRCVRFCQV